MKLDPRLLGLGITLLFGSIILNAAIFQLYADNRARAIVTADRELMTRAAFIADAVDRTLQARMIETFTFAALPSLRAFAASDTVGRLTRGPVAREELRAIVAADDHIRAASIVDVNGRVAMTTDDSMLADWGERAFVREPMRGQLFASVPARDFGEISTYYGAPILNNAGDVAGALVLRISAEELGSTLGTFTDVLLVDDDGVRVVDHTTKPQTFVVLAPMTADAMTRALAQRKYGAEVTQIRATNLALLRDEISRGRSTPIVYAEADGKTIHAGTRRLRTNSWTVVVLQSESAMVESARDTLAAMIIVAALSILTALPLGFLVGRALRPAG
ncbi:MAG: cache domain-containing protein [Chloroflexi bacterium]|nr:cache domain-containing protein [Chloroflexota bacterium]